MVGEYIAKEGIYNADIFLGIYSAAFDTFDHSRIVYKNKTTKAFENDCYVGTSTTFLYIHTCTYFARTRIFSALSPILI